MLDNGKKYFLSWSVLSLQKVFWKESIFIIILGSTTHYLKTNNNLFKAFIVK